MKILALLSIMATMAQLYWVQTQFDLGISIIVAGICLGLALKVWSADDEYMSWVIDAPWKILIWGLAIGTVGFFVGLKVDRPWFWIAGTSAIAPMAYLEALRQKHSSKGAC